MPADLADAQAAPPPPAPQTEPDDVIPDPLDDVSAGRVPAVSLPPIIGGAMGPQQGFVVQNFSQLARFNLAYHEFDSKVSVVYNPAATSEKRLDEAYKKGILDEAAPLVGGPKAAQGAPPPAEAGAGGPPGAELAPAPAMAPQPAPQMAPPEAAQAAPAADLSGATVPMDRRMQEVRLQNTKTPGPAQPNPVPGQLAKRAL